VTAVQVNKVSQISDWQRNFKRFTEQQVNFVEQASKPANVS